MTSFRFYLVVFLVTFTTACAPLWQQRPEVDAETLWDLRHKELVLLDQWQIQGRTVITQDKEGWNAGLRWQENRGVYQIKLQGPFAQGGVTIDGNDEQAILTMADGEQVTSSSPEALILETLGVQLPVSALRDWVRGMPYQSKGYEEIRFDQDGRLIYLVQQGWEIEYLRYIPFKHHSMPEKIFINHADIRLRLVISDWDAVE